MLVLSQTPLWGHQLASLQQDHRCWCPQLLYWTSRYVMRFLVSLEYPSGFRPVMMVIRVHNI